MAEEIMELEVVSTEPIIPATTVYRSLAEITLTTGKLEITSDELGDIFKETVPAGATWYIALRVIVTEVENL